MSTKYTIGQMNQLGDALEIAGFTPEQVTKMRNYPNWKDIKQVLEGHAEIKLLEHVIDLDVNPFCPNGLTVEEHQKGGTFHWDPTKVQLYLSKTQSKGEFIGGHDLRKDLAGKPVLKACLLDYLIKNPHLIPDAWKGKAVFFWGTIYHDSVGDLYVRYLYWGDGQWHSDSSWLGGDWYDDDPAVLRVS